MIEKLPAEDNQTLQVHSYLHAQAVIENRNKINEIIDHLNKTNDQTN